MDAPPVTRSSIAAKIWDFVYGTLLVGGAPLVASGVLYMLFVRPMFSLDGHHGGQNGIFYQVIEWIGVMGMGISTVAPFFAFALAVWWRRKHRVLPQEWLALEVVLGGIWAFCFYGFLFGLKLP